MSRRKQRHPKSLKENEEMPFILPEELEYNEESDHIIARVDLKQDHCFGPFPATVTIEDRTECFQLLDIKHNWLAHCSLSNNVLVNLNIKFENNQLFIITKESTVSGTSLYLSGTIRPKPSMNQDIQIKAEPTDIEPEETEPKTITSSPTDPHYPLIFNCDTCGVRFSNRHTLDAHRLHYCTKHETTKSHSTDSAVTIGIKSIKRKSTDIVDSSSTPTKRLSLLSNDTYCQECDIMFSKADNLIQHKLYDCQTNRSTYQMKNQSILLDRPVQIGKFIYVPIPVISSKDDTSNQDNKPLDLSKPKKAVENYERSRVLSNAPIDLSIDKTQKTMQKKLYRCEYCSISFHSLKNLHAHQDNYCIEYRKYNKKDHQYGSVNATETDRGLQSIPISLSNISRSPPIDSLNPTHRSFLFMCRLCRYQGNTIRGLRMHFKFHLSNNELCTDDDIIVKPTIKNCLSIPIRTTAELLKCKICSAMFDREDIILNHMVNVHTNETLLECSACQSRFSSKWNLIRHMKLVHTNIKSDDETEDEDEDEENQQQQQQQIKPNGSLSDHKVRSSNPMNLIQQILIKSINTNSMQKNLCCPFCHIKFSRVDTLEQHMSNYCSARPTNDDIIQYMVKTKANDTYCSSCQISFKQRKSYDAHKRYYCPDSSKTDFKISV